MKLKKIASLMLAGVMAVSMLAGCSNGTKPENPTNEPTGDNASIATYLNDAQKYNDGVKIDFTYDASMEKAMTQILNDDKDVSAYLPKLMDVESVAYDKLMGNTAMNYNSLKAGTQTNLFIVTDGNKENMTDEALMKSILNSDYANFSTPKDEYLAEDTHKGKIDYGFDYTGKVAMVKNTKDGITTRYVAFMITCTTAATVAEAE